MGRPLHVPGQLRTHVGTTAAEHVLAHEHVQGDVVLLCLAMGTIEAVEGA